MAEAYYEPTPATDGATMNPVPGAPFQVFEIADTSFSTPLSLRVGSGNPTTSVTASDTLATLPGVYVTSPNFEHIWKSGTFEWRRDSIDGAKKAIEDAKLAASNSASASDASAVSAATSAQAAQDAAALVDAPADQIMADTAANPATAFASQLSATIAEQIADAPAPEHVNTVIIFGDSLTAQNGPGPSTLNPTAPQDAQDARGYWHWANAYMSQRARLVRNAGIGGNTTANMLTRIDADVLAHASDWVVFCAGANDVAQGRTLAAIQADYTAILDKLQDAGRKVLVLNVPPSANYTTTAMKDVLGKLNRWIGDLPFNRQGIAAVDIWRTIADPATSSPATGMATDGIHWSSAGAMRVGKAVADVLAPLLNPRPNRVLGLLDPENIHGNPHFGTGTGWATLGAGVTAAYATAPNRWSSEATLTISGVADNAERGIQYIEPIANGKYAAGDIVQASARFKWSGVVPISSATGFFQPFIRIYPRLADGSFAPGVLAMAVSSSNATVNNGIPTEGEVVAITARLTLPANVANLYLAVGWQGIASGTLKISDTAWWKNA